MKHRNIAVFAACLLTGVGLSVAFKYEILWDFMNYHYYNGYALTAGRLGYDIAPASLNTYFNPLLDVLTFWLVNALNDYPDLYYAITGVPFGLLLFACFKINSLFLKDFRLNIAALIIGATGFATWFQIGSSTNEIPAALLVMTGLYLLLKSLFVKFDPVAFCAAAFITGAAAGLKATAVIYCFACGCALIRFYKHLDKPVYRVVSFALSGLAGFLAVNGFWMYKLYVLFQNPVFPFLNKIFKSPFFDDVNYSYRLIFIERSWLDALTLPFSFAAHFTPSYAANTVFSDCRVPFLIILFFCSLPFYKRVLNDKPLSFLILWGTAAFILWLYFFSVARYLIPVEMLAGLFAVLAARFLFSRFSGFFARAALASLFIFCAGVFLSTPLLSNSWGDRKNWTKVFEMPDIRLPENTVLITKKEQNASIAALMAQKAPLRILHQVLILTAEDRYKNFTSRGEFFRKMQDILKETPAKNTAVLITSPPFPLPKPEGTKCRLFSELSNKTFAAEDVTQVSISLLYRLTYSHLLCVPPEAYQAVFEHSF